MSTVIKLVAEVGIAAACRALQLQRSELYRDLTARGVHPLPPLSSEPPTRRDRRWRYHSCLDEANDLQHRLFTARGTELGWRHTQRHDVMIRS